MIQPTELLKDFGVMGVVLDDAFVSIFRTDVILLLFVDVADLKPYVRVREW